MILSDSSTRFLCLLGYIILFPVVIYAQAPSEYASPSIHEILHFLGKSRQDISALTQTRKLLKMNYDSLVFDIEQIKQSGDVGFFDRIRLKNTLKESEDIANQFVEIDNLIKAHEDANSQKISNLVVLMEKEVADSVEVLFVRYGNKKTVITESFTKLANMLAEKKAFYFYRLRKFNMPVTDIRFKKDDEAEVLYQKSDYLLDQIDRLSDYSKELDLVAQFLMEENKAKKKIIRLTQLNQLANNSLPDLLCYFPDSILAFQRLPLSRSLVTPFDDYETLIQRLSLEKDAALSRIDLYREESADIREMADYKNKMWNK